MAKGRSERNRMRYKLWSQMKRCQKMDDEIQEMMRVYIAAGCDLEAAVVANLREPIAMLAKLIEAARDGI